MTAGERNRLLLELRPVVDRLINQTEPEDFPALNKEIERKWPPREAYIAVGMLDRACCAIDEAEAE